MGKRKRIYRILSLVMAFVLIMGDGDLIVLADTVAETVSENQASVSDSDLMEEPVPPTVSDSDFEEYDTETIVISKEPIEAEIDFINMNEEYTTYVQSMAEDGNYKLTETQWLLQCSNWI